MAFAPEYRDALDRYLAKALARDPAHRRRLDRIAAYRPRREPWWLGVVLSAVAVGIAVAVGLAQGGW